MANIRVDVEYTIIDGSEVVFRSPVDCSAITGLKVYYPVSDGATASKVFALADAHGNNVGNIDHLFAEDVVVKVILDVTKGMAFVQNADTNAYLEAQLASKAPAGYGLGVGSQEPLSSDLNGATRCGWYAFTSNTANRPFDYGSVMVTNRYGNQVTQLAFNPYMAGTGEMCVRHFYDNWTEWEYINPPMKPGVEYRTAERMNGKAVYKRMTSAGVVEYRLDGETKWNNYAVKLGAAPAGCGYGDAMTFYNVQDGTFEATMDQVLAEMPIYGARQIQFIDKTGLSTTIYQGTLWKYTNDNAVLTGISTAGTKASKTKQSGNWNAWEFLNPGVVGVEQITMERYNHKPVKTKVINCGTVAKGGTLSVPHNCNISVLVRANIVVGRNSLPYLYNGDPTSQYSITGYVNKDNVVVKNGSGNSDNTVYAQIWYTNT